MTRKIVDIRYSTILNELIITFKDGKDMYVANVRCREINKRTR